jgi:hypothetical protein
VLFALRKKRQDAAHNDDGNGKPISQYGAVSLKPHDDYDSGKLEPNAPDYGRGNID